VLPVYVAMAFPLSLIALAVIRADRKDLPAIIRALFGRPDDDNNGDGPPVLPGP
jgi:hypothetical protein